MLCWKVHCTFTCTYNFILNLHAENVPTVSSHQAVGGQMAQKDDEPDTLPTPLSGVFCWDCGISSLCTCKIFQWCSITHCSDQRAHEASPRFSNHRQDGYNQPGEWNLHTILWIEQHGAQWACMVWCVASLTVRMLHFDCFIVDCMVRMKIQEFFNQSINDTDWTCL